MLVSCTLTVVEESPEATAVEMIHDCQQEALIELKSCWKRRRGEEGILLRIKDGLSHLSSPRFREHSLVGGL